MNEFVAIALASSTLFMGLEDATFRGVVMDAQEQPIANARVDVATAAPKTGPSLFCPSCYTDCVKWAQTDSQGRFEITELDPSLEFRLLCTAVGFKTQQTPLTDPSAGEVQFMMDPLPSDMPARRTLRAQIVSNDGQPIAGALVTPYGAKTSAKRWWGRVEVDSVISDADGRISMLLPADFLALDLTITAHGYAGDLFELLEPGQKSHRLTVPTGTEVRGHVTYQGQPVPKMSVAVVQVDRSSSRHFIKAVGCVTGSDGRFLFEYLPADQQYAIYSVVGDRSTQGQDFVLSTKTFAARADGQARDLGLLEVTQALTLSGYLLLPDAAKLPANAKIVLSRDPAWDLIAFPIQRDGSFRITGLPPETYTVRIAAAGLELDSSGLNYQILKGTSFGIHLSESIVGLAIPMRKKAE